MEIILLVEILKHTPTWVFILFFVLLVLGYFQSKPRTIDRRKVFILPCSMIALSLYSVISAFNVDISGLLAWAIGFSIATWIGLKIASPKGVVYLDSEQAFMIPGSWFPLLLMMAIFMTKYSVGVVLARELPIAENLAFILLISFLYGCFSGLFFSRLLVIWQAVSRKEMANT